MRRALGLAALLAAVVVVPPVIVLEGRSGGDRAAPPPTGDGQTDASSPAPPPESQVNLWLDPDGGSCARRPAPAAYVDADACGTLDAAFKAAEPGDLVLLTCGRGTCDFGSAPQVIRGDDGKASDAHVTFRPASAKRIVTGDVLFQGATGAGAVAPKHITLRGDDRWTLDDDFYVYPGGRDITVRGIRAAKFYIRCGFDITVEESEFTDRVATGVPTISSPFGQAVPPGETSVCAPGTPAERVTIRGNLFHEIWKPVGCANSECHRECLHVQGVDELLIEGNRFQDCLGSTAALSFNIHDGSYIANVEVVRNGFTRTYADTVDDACPGRRDCARRRGQGAGLAIHFSTDSGDGCEVAVRANSFVDGGGSISGECPERDDGVVIRSNRFDAAPGCRANAPEYSWRDNVAAVGTWDGACDDGGNRAGAATNG